MGVPDAQTFDMAGSLLTAKDGPPFELYNEHGRSNIILVCEHASNRVPERLNNLGLTSEQLSSHIGWDPGALDLGARLSTQLDAVFLAARFSRLVYDCNRPPKAESAMPYDTEVCKVPGNEAITADARLTRADEIYLPFHKELARLIADKRSFGADPVLVTIHSFTPVFHGQKRDIEIGFLHGSDNRLAKAMLRHSNSESISDIRVNEPYSPSDGVLHSINRHVENEPLMNVMIEVRNDLLQSEVGLQDTLDLLMSALDGALGEYSKQPNERMIGTE